MPDTEDVTQEVAEFDAKFTVEREAKLFEAGSYPDKGIDVTEEDLDAIVASSSDIPIKIEHGDTPFDGALGTCGKLVRKGKELFGSLSFTDAAWQLLQTTKHRGLSCGIRKDKTGIAEVSLVREPRIATAQVFSADEGIVGFTSDVPWTYNDGATNHKEVTTMPDETKVDKMTLEQAIAVLRSVQPDSDAANAAFSAQNDMTALLKQAQDELIRVAAATRENTRYSQKLITENLIAQFKREGKITPAAEPYARAILNMKPLGPSSVVESECVTFSDKDGNESVIHFADAFAEFLRVMPASVSFSELAKMAAGEDNLLSSEQREINALLGVSDDAFRKIHAGGGA